MTNTPKHLQPEIVKATKYNLDRIDPRKAVDSLLEEIEDVHDRLRKLRLGVEAFQKHEAVDSVDIDWELPNVEDLIAKANYSLEQASKKVQTIWAETERQFPVQPLKEGDRVRASIAHTDKIGTKEIRIAEGTEGKVLYDVEAGEVSVEWDSEKEFDYLATRIRIEDIELITQKENV